MYIHGVCLASVLTEIVYGLFIVHSLNPLFRIASVGCAQSQILY